MKHSFTAVEWSWWDDKVSVGWLLRLISFVFCLFFNQQKKTAFLTSLFLFLYSKWSKKWVPYDAVRFLFVCFFAVCRYFARALLILGGCFAMPHFVFVFVFYLYFYFRQLLWRLKTAIAAAKSEWRPTRNALLISIGRIKLQSEKALRAR